MQGGSRALRGFRRPPAVVVDAAAPRLTVCTPTYNRRHTLARVYDSLARQTAGGFEWLVVDDGSTDGTADQVRVWAAAAPFAVRYQWQANAGKLAAVRAGAQAAAGELMLVADSDDGFMPDTVNVLLSEWNAVAPEQRDALCGIAVLCQDSQGRVVGDPYPAGVEESDFAELFFRWHVRGEKWWAVRTVLMRRYTMNIPGDMRQIPEGVTWFRMARKYRVRLVNRALRIYYRDPDVSRLMLTSARRFAPGGAYYAHMLLSEELRWLSDAPGVFLQAAMNYARFSFHGGIGVPAQWRGLQGPARWLWVACLPLGMLAYAVDQAREERR